MLRSLILIIFFPINGSVTCLAQPAVDALPVFYTLEQEVTVYTEPDSAQPYVQLNFREPVYVIDEERGWSQVRTWDGAKGFVPSYTLSNVWIRISKSKKSLYVYKGTVLLEKMTADFGNNVFSDKEQRGSIREPDHWRTPHGVFFVVRKNPHSTFYKALVLNYPTAEDAERGLQQGLISEAEYQAIITAEITFRMPPMNTALGGMIEIHGNGTGMGSNWTQGCIAVRDDQIDTLWDWVEEGTPVLIEP